MAVSLSQILPVDALIFGLAFSRVGTMVMALPALGEVSVPPRARLMLALGLTLVMAPLVGSAYPQSAASNVLMLTGLILFEIVTGLAIGLLLRMVIGAVQVAGNLIATQSGLAFAQTFDPNQGTQGALTSMFLSLLAVTLIFATDLHHALIAGIEHSYTLFPPGKLPHAGDFATLAIEMMSGMFAMGMQMASPFLVFGLVLYASAGVMSRMMPQLQIFFIVMPLNILAGFVLLALSVSVMMLWFLDAFATKTQLFVPH